MKQPFDKKEFSRKQMRSFLILILIGLIGVASLFCAFNFKNEDSIVAHFGSGNSGHSSSGQGASTSKDPKDYYTTYYFVVGANTDEAFLETITVSADKVIVKSKNRSSSVTEEYAYKYMDLEEAEQYNYNTPLLALYQNGNSAQFLPLQITKDGNGAYYLKLSTSNGIREYTNDAVSWDDIKA